MKMRAAFLFLVVVASSIGETIHVIISTIDIGVGRFRILGGQGLEYWRGRGGGGKFPAGT